MKTSFDIAQLLKALKARIVLAELEIILHPSRRRLQWLGVFTILGHGIFWWLWTDPFPQAFEDGRVRTLLALTGLGLVFIPPGEADHSREVRLYFSFVCWLQLPFFFFWMYWMNGDSAMWMATVATMIVVYYQLTDWRLATLGLVGGFCAATALAYEMLTARVSLPAEHVVVFLFAWVSALTLALSSANFRRERLRQSLAVIGIMAHELRTPLATMALIAQAVRTEASEVDIDHGLRLDNLATRMDALTRAINHHIDLQMANARYTYQPRMANLISAQELVQHVLQDYPFGSRRERQCVQVIMHTDFWFYGSQRQFTQVLNNLIKNAMHSLKRAQSRYPQGDLLIELGKREKYGRIQIKDRGVGIEASQIKQIFEPFFSTANETGSGLGLAFCKQVVEAAQGTITVHSEPAMGATFTLQLPSQVAPVEQKTTHHEISPVSPS